MCFWIGLAEAFTCLARAYRSPKYRLRSHPSDLCARTATLKILNPPPRMSFVDSCNYSIMYKAKVDIPNMFQSHLIHISLVELRFTSLKQNINFFLNCM